jgi:hypothetical protein
LFNDPLWHIRCRERASSTTSKAAVATRSPEVCLPPDSGGPSSQTVEPRFFGHSGTGSPQSFLVSREVSGAGKDLTASAARHQTYAPNDQRAADCVGQQVADR